MDVEIVTLAPIASAHSGLIDEAVELFGEKVFVREPSLDAKVRRLLTPNPSPEPNPDSNPL